MILTIKTNTEILNGAHHLVWHHYLTSTTISDWLPVSLHVLQNGNSCEHQDKRTRTCMLSQPGVKHLQLAASTTVTSDPKTFKGKCVSWRGKGGGRGNQRICLGLRHGLVWERGGACLGERGDCDESGNHGDPREPSFRGGKHPAASSTRCKFLHCYRTLMQLKLWMSKWIRHTLKRGKPPVSRRPGLRFRPTFSEPMQDFPSL